MPIKLDDDDPSSVKVKDLVVAMAAKDKISPETLEAMKRIAMMPTTSIFHEGGFVGGAKGTLTKGELASPFDLPPERFTVTKKRFMDEALTSGWSWEDRQKPTFNWGEESTEEKPEEPPRYADAGEWA